jgi:GNAT superfamily N-acetyltransferase
VRIRIATPADIPAMHRIRLSVRENVLRDAARVQPPDYAQRLSGAGRGWVALEDDAVVGFGIADAATRNVWALFVDPAFEGRGIGRTLHDELLGWLFDQGPEPVWLTTEPGTRAEQFYTVAGWQFVRVEPGGERRLTFHRFDDEA